MESGELVASLVESFAANVVAQRNASTATVGNRHARKSLDAAKNLLRLGDEGIDALATLLQHKDPDVRVDAAAVLLKDRTEQAVAALRPIAANPRFGLAAFGAQMTLERYSEGVLTIEGLND